jgi:hypothetical protein
MEQERRHHKRRKEDREVSYEVLAYQLECANDDLKEISNDIRDMNNRMNKE